MDADKTLLCYRANLNVCNVKIDIILQIATLLISSLNNKQGMNKVWFWYCYQNSCIANALISIHFKQHPAIETCLPYVDAVAAC